ncbi:MAG: HAD hydrolase-like protein, partial [Lachnospiraceae bacterium]|nr:HAD hydrolase-like protein [Lachnospiraceae bacterium]
MYKYIFFDLDGTLTDPREGITKSVQYALSHMGIEEKDLTKLEPFIGPPLVESFMEYYDFSMEQAREAVEHYRVYFSKRG